ncbi:YggT family protein [Candidatus Microgenomates bacterium]|nr:YggT family protein [Candidatus Microgenomates bacterium]
MDRIEGEIYDVVVTIIDVVFAIVVLVLGARIIIQLLGASTAAPIVRWIYDVSSQLIVPVAGVFPNIFLGGGSVLDVVAIVGLVLYCIVFFVIRNLIDTLAGASTLGIWGRFRHPHVS